MVGGVSVPEGTEERERTVFNKACSLGVVLGRDVVFRLASRGRGTDEEREAATERLVREAQVRGIPLTPDIVDEILGAPEPFLSPEEVLKGVVSYYGMDSTLLCGSGRTKDVVLARHVLMWLLKELCGMSSPRAGEFVGGRDHSTVLYAWKAFEQRLDEKPSLKAEVYKIAACIREGVSPPSRAQENLGSRPAVLLQDFSDLRVQEALRAVSLHYGVDEKALLGRSRVRNIPLARSVLIWLLRKKCQMQLKDVGWFVGGRSVDAVFSQVRRIERRLEKDPYLKNDLDKLARRLSTP